MKRTLFALAVAAALPFAAHAQDAGLSYTYAEADYINLDNDLDGWALRGSYNFGDTGLYALGSYSWLSTDDDLLGDDSASANELGLGYHHSVAENTDLIGEVAYRNTEFDNFRIDGARVSAGVRSAMTPHFEGFAKANYYDGSDYTGDFTGTLGAQYKFNPTWGMTAEAEFGEDNQTYLVGVRASF